MAAPKHLLNHPPLKVSAPFGQLCSRSQLQVMDLMTLLWHTEPYDVPEQPIERDSDGYTELPPGLTVSPCSVCYSQGLTGHVAMVRNRRGRGTPLTEEFFLSFFPNTLAVGLHSLFLDPDDSTTLCVVTIESSLTNEANS